MEASLQYATGALPSPLKRAPFSCYPHTIVQISDRKRVAFVAHASSFVHICLVEKSIVIIILSLNIFMFYLYRFTRHHSKFCCTVGILGSVSTF